MESLSSVRPSGIALLYPCREAGNETRSPLFSHVNLRVAVGSASKL